MPIRAPAMRGAHRRKLQAVATALCCRVLWEEDAPTTDWKEKACAQNSPEGNRRSAKWGGYNVGVLSKSCSPREAAV